MRRVVLFPVVFAVAFGVGAVIHRAPEPGPSAWRELAPEDAPLVDHVFAMGDARLPAGARVEIARYRGTGMIYATASVSSGSECQVTTSGWRLGPLGPFELRSMRNATSSAQDVLDLQLYAVAGRYGFTLGAVASTALGGEVTLTWSFRSEDPDASCERIWHLDPSPDLGSVHSGAYVALPVRVTELPSTDYLLSLRAGSSEEAHEAIALSQPQSLESSPKFSDITLGCPPSDAHAWRNAALARLDAELERDSGTSTCSIAFVGTASCWHDWLLIRPDGTVEWHELDPFDVAAVESAAVTLNVEGGMVRALARLARLEAKR